MPTVCPHDNLRVVAGGPYYRQVHPNNFQEGRALSSAFTLQDTGCHLTMSLNDGARTTAERCYLEYTQNGERLSAAALTITEQELVESGAAGIVDSPGEETHAHVDAIYEKPLSRRQQRNVGQFLATATNRRGPAYRQSTD